MIIRRSSFENKKSIAIVLVLLMLASILFSYYFIIENEHHDCIGESCPICLQIEEAIQFMQSIKYVPILAFIMVVQCLFIKWIPNKADQVYLKDTLISLKVELLN